MTHVPERRFHDAVADFLSDKFPGADIESEPRLTGSGRIPDFRVTTTGGDVYVVEVENGDDPYGGMGQALGYAAHDPEYIPAVVQPESETPQPEWNQIQRHVIGWTVELGDDHQ